MKHFVYRTLIAVLLISLGMLSAAQDSYPQHPVTLVVPIAAAGGTDTIRRFIADRLGKVLKQPFIVENRPGANGVLGTDNVARAKPDGYCRLFTYADYGLFLN